MTGPVTSQCPRPAAGARLPHATRQRRWRRFVPPQHGAWAMLLLPYLAAVLVVGARWPHLPLLGAWLGGYLLSYYAGQAVKTRRPGRFRAQLVAYAAVTAPLAAVVVVARPAVLWYAPAFAVLLAVNGVYAWRRRDRALGNDLALIGLSALMIPVAATVAGAPPAEVVHVLVAVPAYFVGTVLHVKTMIRERGNPAYRRASVAYHAAAVPVAAWISLPLGAVFALLLVRAWVLPGRRVSPKRLGVLEIALTLCVLAAVVAA